MKKLFATIGITAVLTLAFCLGSAVLAKSSKTIPAPEPKVWGAFTGGTDQTMTAFDLQVAKRMPVDAIFSDWSTNFPTTTAGYYGQTLLIYWEPSFGYDQINNGSKDAYIAAFAQSARAYGHPVILVPFDEFNLDESVWGNAVGANTPQSFISAWQRVHNIFAMNGVTNVKFGLAYNNVSIPSAAFAGFYPGNAYVDYVGVDGFNATGTQTFSQVFSSALTQVRTFGKPVWIFSAGSIAPSSQFITDMGATGLPWIWFNQAPYNIDASSLAAFRSII